LPSCPFETRARRTAALALRCRCPGCSSGAGRAWCVRGRSACGAGVGVAGSDLDVAKVDAGVEHRCDVGVAHVCGYMRGAGGRRRRRGGMRRATAWRSTRRPAGSASCSGMCQLARSRP
jgi:hypothetical protein